jgi:hypothetical protein
MTNAPKIGDEIYVTPGDWNSGGKAIISAIEPGISAGEHVPFVSIEGNPGRRWNWEILAGKQAFLKEHYGRFIATPDDYEGIIVDGHLWLRRRW